VYPILNEGAISRLPCRILQTEGMLSEVVPLLMCPWCRADGLMLRGDAIKGRVRQGTLSCGECGKVTTIAGGIWLAMGIGKRQRSIAQLTNVWPNAIFYESLWRPGALSRFSGRKFPLSEELGEMTAAMKPSPEQVFVDVACSEGLYARTLAQSGAVVFAVEHSVPMLRKVVKRSGSLPVIAVQAVAQHLPFATNKTDGVVIGGSFNEIGDRAAAVTEMTRITRVGGTVFSMHLNQARTAGGRFLQGALKPNGIVFASADQWRRDITAAGLHVQSEHTDAIVTRMTLTKL
jgi:2-polyprenyl-3-methyl-5-hydroxy-6-metoxy-1,4-benzoquinol methylase